VAAPLPAAPPPPALGSGSPNVLATRRRLRNTSRDACASSYTAPIVRRATRPTTTLNAIVHSTTATKKSRGTRSSAGSCSCWGGGEGARVRSARSRDGDSPSHGAGQSTARSGPWSCNPDSTTRDSACTRASVPDADQARNVATFGTSSARRSLRRLHHAARRAWSGRASAQRATSAARVGATTTSSASTDEASELVNLHGTGASAVARYDARAACVSASSATTVARARHHQRVEGAMASSRVRPRR